jgi:hypothetical protein
MISRTKSGKFDQRSKFGKKMQAIADAPAKTKQDKIAELINDISIETAIAYRALGDIQYTLKKIAELQEVQS